MSARSSAPRSTSIWITADQCSLRNSALAGVSRGSAVVLMMELTGQDRSFIAPLLLTVVIATLLSRLIEPRSIYDARLTDEEIAQRQKLREPAKR